MREQREIDFIERLKRSERLPDDALTNGSREQKKHPSPEFFERLKYGKESEDRLVEYLIHLGALEVKDISAYQMSEGYFSPFDLEVIFPNKVGYVIDYKHWNIFADSRRRGYVMVPTYYVERWEKYETPLNKLLMFEVSKPNTAYFKTYKTATVDWLCIVIEEIRKVSWISMSGEHYKIDNSSLKLFRRLRGETIE